MSIEDKDALIQRIRRITDVGKEPLEFLAAITGYQDKPIVSIEKAVESLESDVSFIKNQAYIAKMRCQNLTNELTQDEAAAIMLYTMSWEPTCLFSVLNATLRMKDRSKLKAWFLYLKLLFVALDRLPSSTSRTLFRGVKLDLSDKYKLENSIVWWGFSSCTISEHILESEEFLGKTGKRTKFIITCNSGKDIRNYSYYPDEDEVLLLPAIQFEIIKICQTESDSYEIHLKEVQPAVLLREIVSTSSISDITSSLQYLPSITQPTAIQSSTNRTIQNPNITAAPLRRSLTDIPLNTTWNKDGYTIARKNPTLYSPHGLYVDDDQTVYVADFNNNCIVAWKSGETNGQVVAGGHGPGNCANQLHWPADVIVDKERDSLIICDRGNDRIVRGPRQNGTSGETIISNIISFGLTMDKNGFLYVTDIVRHEVRKYRMGESEGSVVAGGNGQGDRLDQLNSPIGIFVDQEHSVFVSDSWNNRVMKWIVGAKEGIVVAGGQGKGNSLTQLNGPRGIVVDQLDTVYVADQGNNRVMRWLKGAQQGNVIIGGNGWGTQANQLRGPTGLSFDRHGNLYVVDNENKRVQRFTIEMPRKWKWKWWT